MSIPLSIAIIGKNNESTLPQLFESLKSVDAFEIVFVDTGSTDKSKEIAASFGARVFDFEWCDNFSKARTFSFEQCTQDWVMWIDTDDVLLHGENVGKLLELAKNKDVNGFLLPYQYIVDADGNVLNEQMRTRIVFKKDFEWKGAVHEDILPIRERLVITNSDVVVKHTAYTNDNTVNTEKLERNLSILQKALKEEKEKKSLDARTVLYYGHTLFGLYRFEEARDAYYTYTKMSGWEEDLYMAYIRLAICDRELGDFDMSMESIQMAWTLEPSAPEAYLQLGLTYMKMGLYKKAIQAAEAVSRFVDVQYQRGTTYFPMDYVWYPLLIKADSYLELSNHKKALEYYIQLKDKKFPQKNLDEMIANISEVINEEATVKKYFEQSLDCKTDEERESLYRSIPENLRQYPSVVEIRKSFNIKKESSGKDVVFMCGFAYEEWTPENVHTTGIGGSEEAVINMAQQLKLRGYNVTVYNTVTEVKSFDGVVYKPWWEFNPKDKVDVFIGWRFENFFDNDINATKKYLWLHDVVFEKEYTKERLERIDKILVLSEYHRKNLPNIPDDKFYITSNGVDVSLFEEQEKEVVRNPFQFIYTSSYDRGLEQLLEMWKEIKTRVPEATLSVYYGWGNFDKRFSDNPERKLWKNRIVELLKQDGIKEFGRVSHAEIAKAMLSSGIWAYPSTWLETNCITGLKAQIAGAVPVVTTLGALSETVQFGKKVDVDIRTPEGKSAFIECLVNTVYNQDEQERLQMMNTMREKYSWSNITEQWIKDLF